jgi:hypothetical protein
MIKRSKLRIFAVEEEVEIQIVMVKFDYQLD